MTDHTVREVDAPPAGSVWCVSCGVHAARNGTRCPVCSPQSYPCHTDDPRAHLYTPTTITGACETTWRPQQQQESA